MELINALKKNDINNFRRLLPEYEDIINDKFDFWPLGFNTTMLIYGCYFNHFEFVKLLINCASIDISKTINKIIPLHAACFNRNYKIVKLILRIKNVDVNECNGEKETVLHIACIERQYLITKLLLKNKFIKLNYKDYRRDTAFNILFSGILQIKIMKLFLCNRKVDFNTYENKYSISELITSNYIFVSNFLKQDDEYK